MEVKVGSSTKSSSQTILFGVLILVVAAGVGYWYMNRPSSDAVVVEAPTAAVSVANDDPRVQEILNSINVLEHLNLDTEFFNDERFAALRLTPIIIPPAQPTRQSVLRFKATK